MMKTIVALFVSHLGQSIPTISEIGFAALALVLTLAALLRLR